MELNQKENELHVYSINENEHIGAINLSFDSRFSFELIVVQDCSSAVGDAAERAVKEILPLFVSKIQDLNKNVQIFTFGDESVVKRVHVNDLSKFDLKCGGATNIGDAIEKLRLHFEGCSISSYFFYVLTISAGEVRDRENAERETKKLTDVLATKNCWRINSQAVRLLTTPHSRRPDTKALSYLLQINNSTEANICDINVTSSNETIANEIAALFTKNAERKGYLKIEKPIISRFPWQSSYSKDFVVSNGWNIFWLSELPTTKSIKLDKSGADLTINVVADGQITLEKFQQLMEKKLPHMVSHMKILKIVGTVEANEAVDQIFSYFAKTEEALAVKSSTSNTKIITNALAGVAMYRPDFRDSDEMLEFYRNHSKAIEDQIEMDRLKKKEEEEELQKREQEERQQEEERQKREQEKRLEQEDEERQKQEDSKREEEIRVRRYEEAPAACTVDPNSIQTVFILDEQLPEANDNRQFMEKIIPLMLSKVFHESVQLFYQVTFVRYNSSAAEMLQSLVETLDPTKQIRISILTNGDVHEMENFAKMVIEFLNGSSYAFELQLARLASTHKRYKSVDINANESNEFIAEQIISQCHFDKASSDVTVPTGRPSNVAYYWVLYFIIFVIFYYYFCF